MTQPDAGALVGALVLLVLSIVVAAGVYVWYAIALARLFPKLGADSWKGWVPVLNEAEILSRGGVPAWSVVFYFVPVVQLYGLYLKVLALSRIHAKLGRGVGMTLLGVLLPPVWATVLAGDTVHEDGEFDQRVHNILGSPARPAAPSVASGPLAAPFPHQTDASGYALPSTPAPAAPQMAVAALVAPEAVSPVPVPVLPIATAEPVDVASEAPRIIHNPWAPKAVDAAAEKPPLIAPPAPVPVRPLVVEEQAAAVPQIVLPPRPAAAEQEPPEPETPAAVIAPVPTEESEPLVVEPALSTPPTIAPSPDSLQPLEPMAVQHVEPESVSDAPHTAAPVDLEPTVITPAAGAAFDEADDDDELDRTVVVDRRPVVPWKLIVDNGFTVALTQEKVILGRKPASDDPEITAIAVPDTTRTLSKSHARLELDDGAWTVFDLNATNGVIVVGADGAETLLPGGGSAIVSGRFILGKVGMRVSFESEPTA